MDTLRRSLGFLWQFVCPILTAAVLYFIVTGESQKRDSVVIHVCADHVLLEVDEIVTPIENANASTILMDLEPGRHVLRLREGEKVVHEETFSVIAGESIVLTAWRSQQMAKGQQADTLANAGINLPNYLNGLNIRRWASP